MENMARQHGFLCFKMYDFNPKNKSMSVASIMIQDGKHCLQYTVKPHKETQMSMRIKIKTTVYLHACNPTNYKSLRGGSTRTKYRKPMQI